MQLLGTLSQPNTPLQALHWRDLLGCSRPKALLPTQEEQPELSVAVMRTPLGQQRSSSDLRCKKPTHKIRNHPLQKP